jgi:hypothetical protein
MFIFNIKGTLVDASSIGELRISGPGWICYKNTGRSLNLEMQGKGNSVGLKDDFSATNELFIGKETVLTIEEIEGLRVVLKPTGWVYDDEDRAFLTISVKKQDGAALTDGIFLRVTDASEFEYPQNGVYFDENESYIEIPVPNCFIAGKWAGIKASSCENGIAKYKIGTI